MSGLTTPRERRALAIALTVVGSVCVGLGAATFLGAVWNDEHRCAWSTAPAESVVSEMRPPRPGISVFPLGISCSWPMADGSRQVTPEPNLWLSLFVYGGLGAIAVGFTVVALGRASRIADRPEP